MAKGGGGSARGNCDAYYLNDEGAANRENKKRATKEPNVDEPKAREQARNANVRICMC